MKTTSTKDVALPTCATYTKHSLHIRWVPMSSETLPWHYPKNCQLAEHMYVSTAWCMEDNQAYFVVYEDLSRLRISVIFTIDHFVWGYMTGSGSFVWTSIRKQTAAMWQMQTSNHLAKDMVVMPAYFYAWSVRFYHMRAHGTMFALQMDTTCIYSNLFCWNRPTKNSRCIYCNLFLE